MPIITNLIFPHFNYFIYLCAYIGISKQEIWMIAKQKCLSIPSGKGC